MRYGTRGWNWRRFSPLLAVTVSLWALHTGDAITAANAQAIGDSNSGNILNVFLPADRETIKTLDLAREALADEKYNEAVRHLGFLASEEVEDFFIHPEEEGNAQTSLKAEARKLISGLPPRGRQAYQLQFADTAQLLFTEALQSRDMAKLTTITRKYFHTPAGYEASMLLGRYLLSQGQPLSAALTLHPLGDAPPSVVAKYDPEFSLLLAAAWLSAGNESNAHKVLVAFAARAKADEINIGGQQLELFARETDAVSWLRDALGEIDLMQTLTKSDWAMHRGNASRNATTQPSTPLGTIRWKVPTPNDPSEQELLRDQQREYTKSGIAAIPAAHPLVVRYRRFNEEEVFRQVVLTRTPQRLLAVDYKTGQRIWFYVPLGMEAPGDSFQFSSPQAALGPRAAELRQRTWSDAPFGQLSSDGEKVYLVDDLFTAEKNMQRVTVLPGGIRRANPNSPKPFNQLVALSLPRQGSRVWTTGGEDGGSEPDLAGAFFLGPPLPLMDELYVIAEKKGDIRLVALDAAKGTRLWEQQLCGVDQQAILDDWTRRLGGATPSFADGVLICPTSAGAVVAVDLAKRSLMWGFQYVKQPESPTRQGGFFPVSRSRRKAIKPGEAWVDSTITIDSGKVVLTPVEADEMFCLNLIDGKKLWTRERGDLLYVAGVHDGNVVVVGTSEVLALRMNDGETIWKAPLPASAVASGRGFLSDKHFYLPLSSAELMKIELGGGRIARLAKTSGVLGNLVTQGDTLVSQGPTELRAFYRQEALAELVPKRLQANPSDPWALARQGEILLAEGDRLAALQQLRKAYRIDPKDDVKSLLVETLLGALEEDFAANRQLAVEVDDLIDRVDQRADYLRLMAQGLQEVGELERAFTFYLRIVDEAQADSQWAPGTTGSANMKQVSRTHEVRHDRWWQGQLATLLTAADTQQLQAIEAEIQTRLHDVIAADSTAALRSFIGHFGVHPSVNLARLELAKRLIDSEEFLEAELLLNHLRLNEQPQIAAPATAQLAALLQYAGEIDESATCYRELRDKWTNVDTGNGKTGSQRAAALDQDSAVFARLNSQHQWPNGRAETRPEGPASRYSSYQRIYATQLNDVQGVVAPNSQIMLDRQRRIILQDGLGREQVSLQLSGSETTRYYSANYSLTSGKRNGHLLLLSLGYEIFAIDLLNTTGNASQRELWRLNLSSISKSTSSRGRQMQPKKRSADWGGERFFAADSEGRPIASFGPITHQGICLRRLGQLVCVDPIRPDLVYWSRDGVADGTAVFGDENLVLLVAPNETKAEVIRAVDGTSLGQCDVAANSQRWATIGTDILRWEQTDDQVIVSLQQPWDAGAAQPTAEPTLWQHTFAGGSKGQVVAKDQAFVMEPGGKLSVIDLSNGKIAYTAQLEAESDLAAIHVQVSRNQVIVATTNPISDAPEGINVQPAPGGYGPLGQNSPLIKGHVYALHPQTGKHLWPVSATVEHYGIPLDQPGELPLLALLRNVSPNNNGGSRAWKTNMLFLDKRNGRVVFSKDDVAGQTQVYRLQGNEKESEVALLLPGKTFTIKLTNEPRPPQPPAQTDLSSALSSRSDRKLVASAVDYEDYKFGYTFEDNDDAATPLREGEIEEAGTIGGIPHNPPNRRASREAEQGANE